VCLCVVYQTAALIHNMQTSVVNRNFLCFNIHRH